LHLLQHSLRHVSYTLGPSPTSWNVKVDWLLSRSGPSTFMPKVTSATADEPPSQGRTLGLGWAFELAQGEGESPRLGAQSK